MNTTSKIVKTLKRPYSIPRVARSLVTEYFMRYVVRDEFAITWAQWFRDRGDETLRLDYPLGPESTVIDLGGYRGDFAFNINEKYGCYVHLYEPVQEFYDQCVTRFIGNSRITCHNYALSDEDGETYISNEDNASSIIRNNAPDGERITLKQCSAELKRLGTSKIDLMKMNVEGSEYLLLPHLIDSGAIEHIEFLQVQFHTFFPNAVLLRNEIRSRLMDTHTEQWNYPFAYESWRLRSSRLLMR